MKIEKDYCAKNSNGNNKIDFFLGGALFASQITKLNLPQLHGSLSRRFNSFLCVFLKSYLCKKEGESKETCIKHYLFSILVSALKSAINSLKRVSLNPSINRELLYCNAQTRNPPKSTCIVNGGSESSNLSDTFAANWAAQVGPRHWLFFFLK